MPDASVLRRAGAGRDRADRGERPLAFAGSRGGRSCYHALAFALAWLAVVGPWLVRNAVSAGKWGLTEEYGSAALIERFAYRRHERARIPAGVSVLPAGDRRAAGRSGLRPAGHGNGSSITRPRASSRSAVCVATGWSTAHGRLDPLIKDVIRDEMRERWWRYLLVGLPLAWCGHVGRRAVGPRARAAVRLGLRHGGTPVEAPVPALCRAGRW